MTVVVAVKTEGDVLWKGEPLSDSPLFPNQMAISNSPVFMANKDVQLKRAGALCITLWSMDSVSLSLYLSVFRVE